MGEATVFKINHNNHDREQNWTLLKVKTYIHQKTP